MTRKDIDVNGSSRCHVISATVAIHTDYEGTSEWDPRCSENITRTEGLEKGV